MAIQRVMEELNLLLAALPPSSVYGSVCMVAMSSGIVPIFLVGRIGVLGGKGNVLSLPPSSSFPGETSQMSDSCHLANPGCLGVWKVQQLKLSMFSARKKPCASMVYVVDLTSDYPSDSSALLGTVKPVLLILLSI